MGWGGSYLRAARGHAGCIPTDVIFRYSYLRFFIIQGLDLKSRGPEDGRSDYVRQLRRLAIVIHPSNFLHLPTTP